jgi:hypothetical protein
LCSLNNPMGKMLLWGHLLACHESAEPVNSVCSYSSISLSSNSQSRRWPKWTRDKLCIQTCKWPP